MVKILLILMSLWIPCDGIVKPALTEGYEYDPQYWERLGVPEPTVFYPILGFGVYGSASRRLSDFGPVHRDGGIGNNVSLVGSAMGAALSFPGGTVANAGVVISPSLPSVNTWTWSGWINPGTQTQSYANIFTQGASIGMWLHSGKLDVFTGADHLSNASYVIGAWQHWAVTFQPGTVAIYFNGKLDASVTVANQSYTFNGFGGDNGGTTENFLGLMSQTTFWGGSYLDAAQIYSIYAEPWGMFGLPSSLIGFAALIRNRRTLGPRVGSRSVY